MRGRTFSVAAALAACLAGCAAPGSRSSDCGEAARTVVVYAASSLRAGFDALAGDIADGAGCGARVVFEYGSSGALAARIMNGAPADVFVSAGAAAMRTVVEAGETVGDPVDFLANDARLMVSRVSGKRDEIREIDDLRGHGVLVGLCVVSAPCGALADAVLEKAAAVSGRAISRASVADTESASSADLVTKISLGELDAGIVLSSECVLAAAATVCRTLPRAISTTTVYGVVALTGDETTRRVVGAIRSTGSIGRLSAEHGFSRIPG